MFRRRTITRSTTHEKALQNLFAAAACSLAPPWPHAGAWSRAGFARGSAVMLYLYVHSHRDTPPRPLAPGLHACACGPGGARSWGARCPCASRLGRDGEAKRAPWTSPYMVYSSPICAPGLARSAVVGPPRRRSRSSSAGRCPRTRCGPGRPPAQGSQQPRSCRRGRSRARAPASCGARRGRWA